MAEIFYKQKQFDKSLSYCQKLLEIDEKRWKSIVPGWIGISEKRR